MLPKVTASKKIGTGNEEKMISSVLLVRGA
jgi:hypothetical protein